MVTIKVVVHQYLVEHGDEFRFFLPNFSSAAVRHAAEILNRRIKKQRRIVVVDDFVGVNPTTHITKLIKKHLCWFQEPRSFKNRCVASERPERTRASRRDGDSSGGGFCGRSAESGVNNAGND